MSESRHDGLSRVLTVVALAIIGSVIAFGGVGAWMLGAERVYKLAAVLVGAVALGLVLVAASFPVRAWRRGEEKPERIIEHHDHGTTTERFYYGDAPGKGQGQLPPPATLPPWAITGGGVYDLLPPPAKDDVFQFGLPTGKDDAAPDGWNERG